VAPSGREQASQSPCRFDALESAVTHQAANDCPVLLLDEGLVVLL
jgi:hypothetical protein